MAFARNWRHAWVSETPERVSVREIPSLNAVFSEAFTERYRVRSRSTPISRVRVSAR